MTIVRSTALLLSALLMLLACGIGPERQVAPDEHLLVWQSEPAVVEAPLADGLSVAVPRAYPGFDGAAMVYRQEGNELRYFARNRWVAAPAELIGAAVTEAVADSGVFREVAAPGSSLRLPYRLETDLIHLAQHFENGDSEVRLSIRYRLVAVVSGESLGHMRQTLRHPAPGNDPASGVAAANEALAESLRELIKTLPEWLEKADR